jgi:hypothetical protein
MLALSVCQPWAWAMDLDSSERPTIRAAGWDPGDPVAAIGGIVAVVSLVGVCAAATAAC